MRISALKNYIEGVSDDSEIGVAVYSIETRQIVTVSYSVVADINEYDELIIGIDIETS